MEWFLFLELAIDQIVADISYYFDFNDYDINC